NFVRELEPPSTEDEGRDALQNRGQGQGGYEGCCQGVRSLEERPYHGPLRPSAKSEHNQNCRHDGHREGKEETRCWKGRAVQGARRRVEPPDYVGPRHEEGPVSEVQNPDGRVDQGEAHRHQRVQRAQDYSAEKRWQYERGVDQRTLFHPSLLDKPASPSRFQGLPWRCPASSLRRSRLGR